MRIRYAIVLIIIAVNGYAQTATPTPVKLNLIPDIYASDPWRKWFMTFVELNDFPSDTSNLQAGTVSNVHGELWEWTGAEWIPVRSYEHGYGLSATYVDGVTTFSVWTPTPTQATTPTPTPTLDADIRYITTENGTASTDIGDGTIDIQLAGSGTTSASNQSILIHLPEFVAGLNANASGEINVDQSISNGIIDVTYEVSLTSSVVTEASKAFVAIIDPANNIQDATGRSPFWLQPTPPVRQIVKLENNRIIINTWLDPTATPTPALYESYEEALPVGTRTYQTAYEINYLDRVMYKDVRTTNNALDYHNLEIPRDKYILSGTNEFQLQWSPRTVNSISGGAVVYKIFVYYLYRG